MLKFFRRSLHLHDTLQGRVSQIKFKAGHEAKIYLCGPTVYSDPHLGHGRTAISFDLLNRWLKVKGYNVTFVSNITDIDDKIIDRANSENKTFLEIAVINEKKWWDAMDKLNVLRPDHSPHATAYVNEMVDFINQLLDQKKAYELKDGIYFDTGSIPDYGLLAHQDLSELRLGARVEKNIEKRNETDFVLWKLAKMNEPSWPSPWGPGRPGWHTECVVMSLGILGEGFDLHGGAQDLIFPHHENERAQASALNLDFAHYWLHGGWVTVEGEKMSKSLGNFTTLSEVFEKYPPEAFRLLVLRAHYKSPMEISSDSLEDATQALGRIYALKRRFNLRSPLDQITLENNSDFYETYPFIDKFALALDDDLDAPRAVSIIFEIITKAHQIADSESIERAFPFAQVAIFLASLLGIHAEEKTEEIPDFVLALVDEREKARAEKNYEKSDIIRSKLLSLGYIIEDTRLGPKLYKKPR